MRLLIVEDNQKLASWLAKLLRAERYVVDVVHEGPDGVLALRTQPYDVAIVDLGLPGLGGIELIRTVRQGGTNTPILILTADDSLERRITGLNAGADDYLAKPFEVTELEARIRALARRTGSAKRAQLELGPLHFDQNTKVFSLANVPLFNQLHGEDQLFWLAILALVLVYGAYVAEVYRAGLESVHWSQTAAARSHHSCRSGPLAVRARYRRRTSLSV